jgi:hypothetical protein
MYIYLSKIISRTIALKLKPAEIVAVRLNISEPVVNACRQICKPQITKV